MKLSISIPDQEGEEMKRIAARLERPLSWIIQKAWELSKFKFQDDGAERLEQRQDPLTTLKQLRGCLKKRYPRTTSVDLQRTAFMDRD